MNIVEINGSIPQYWQVLAIGLPLALSTAMVPLAVGPLTRLWLSATKNKLVQELTYVALGLILTVQVVQMVRDKAQPKLCVVAILRNLLCTLYLTRKPMMQESFLDLLVRASIVFIQIAITILSIALMAVDSNAIPWGTVCSIFYC